RPGRPLPHRGLGEMDRRADLLDVAKASMPALPEEGARLQLWVVEDLVVGQDLGARHAGSLQLRYPEGPRLARCHLLDHRDQDVATRMPRWVVLETLVVRPLRVAENIAERPPVARRGGADHEEAIGRMDGLVGRCGLVRRPQRTRNLPRGEVTPRLPHLERNSSLEERHVDELSATGLLTHTQGRESSYGAVQRADQVADRHTDLDRVATRFAGDRHQPAHRLGHDVQPRQLRIRTGLAPTRGGDVDKAWIERRELVVVELEVGHRPRTQVLHDHVPGPDELAENSFAFGLL